MTDISRLNKLTHYYEKGQKPFLSLSSLDMQEALQVISKYDHRRAEVYRRFKNPLKYLEDRYEVESWLRSNFIKKGGKPKTKFPYYLVLGNSSYIYEGYNENCDVIKIPLSELNLTSVSFTYSDSMVSYWLSKEKNNEVYFNPRYHGHVFTYSEIVDVLSQYDLKDGIWDKDRTRAYDFFIEAQVWSEEILKYSI